MSTPATSTKPLFLWTGTTPNGRRPTLFLEELKLAYPGAVDYDYRALKMYTPDGTNEQKEDWYLKINPNGRIPVLVDKTADDFTIHESAAILTYLARKFDTERKFVFDPATQPKETSELEQWIFFIHGGLAPTSGLIWTFNMGFKQYQSEGKMFDATVGYVTGEVKRMLGVLNTRLEGREYLVGNKYTIADLNAFAWVSAAPYSGIQLDEWTNLKAWFDRVGARPAIQAGQNIPPNAW